MEGTDGGYLSAVKVTVPGYNRNCYKHPPLNPCSPSVVSFTRDINGIKRKPLTGASEFYQR